MNRRYALFAILPILLSASDSPGGRSARIAALEETFLAPCCYSEPISRHRNDVALQMKAEIARWVVLLLGLAFTVGLIRRMSSRQGSPQAAGAADLTPDQGWD